MASGEAFSGRRGEFRISVVRRSASSGVGTGEGDWAAHKKPRLARRVIRIDPVFHKCATGSWLPAISSGTMPGGPKPGYGFVPAIAERDFAAGPLKGVPT